MTPEPPLAFYSVTTLYGVRSKRNVNTPFNPPLDTLIYYEPINIVNGVCTFLSNEHELGAHMRILELGTRNKILELEVQRLALKLEEIPPPPPSELETSLNRAEGGRKTQQKPIPDSANRGAVGTTRDVFNECFRYEVTAMLERMSEVTNASYGRLYLMVQALHC